MTHPERIPVLLHHLVVACNRIAAAVEGVTRDAFLLDYKPQDIVLRQIEILGEAAKRIREQDEHYFERSGMADLYRVIGLRNRIAHEYLNVNPSIIWTVAAEEAPKLRAAVLLELQTTNLRFDPDALHF